MLYIYAPDSGEQRGSVLVETDRNDVVAFLTPEQARKLAEQLTDCADYAEQESDAVATVAELDRLEGR